MHLRIKYIYSKLVQVYSVGGNRVVHFLFKGLRWIDKSLILKIS